MSGSGDDVLRPTLPTTTATGYIRRWDTVLLLNTSPRSPDNAVSTEARQHPEAGASHGASLLILVFSVPTAVDVEVERAPTTVGALSGQQRCGTGMEGCDSMLVERAISRPVATPRALETNGRDPRNWINEQTENNKMQRTRPEHLGGGPRR